MLPLSKWSCFLFPKLISFPSSLPSVSQHVRKIAKEGTYGIQENGEEEFTSSDTFVQLLRTARIFLVKNSVSEKATGLSREHLGTKEQQLAGIAET